MGKKEDPIGEETDSVTILTEMPLLNSESHGEVAILELIQGPGSPQKFFLESDSYVLGRSSGADLVIKNPELSRLHAKLIKKEGDWTLLDLGSKNGIFLNQIKVHSATLNQGDTIQMGNLVLVFRWL